MRTKKIVSGICIIALLIGIVPPNNAFAKKKICLSSKSLSIKKGKSKTLSVKNTTKKVKWKITLGKKYISIKNKGKNKISVKGKKKGFAKVQARIGQKKLICKITIKKSTNSKSTNSDERALKKLVTKLKASGASVSTDIHDSYDYSWDKNGRLKRISWNVRNIHGGLDLSSFTALKYLTCYGNEQLTSLNVSNNSALTDLNCSYNKLTSLNVSKNSALKYLECSGNKLTRLDVSKNSVLESLYCNGNKLTSLDVSNNLALTYLECWENKLVTIYASATLKDIRCDRDYNLDIIRK